MPHSEKELTPAQSALVQFVSHLEADGIYKELTITLQQSISSFASPKRDSTPAPKTLDAWHRMLELMEHIHAISVEPRPKG